MELNNKQKIEEFNERYGYSKKDVLLVKKLDNLGLSEPQIVYVLDCIEEICNHCWNKQKPCHCWNDE